MPGGGVSGFGSGGQPNELPSRTYPRHGSATYRDEPDDWAGGARGPAALPSRIIEGGAPAPSQPLVGARGTILQHRGAFIEDAGAPRLSFDGVLGHGAIRWSRPTYANLAGKLGYVPPTQQPSWSADAAVVPGQPTVPIPFSNKHIGSFTVREEYGSTRQWFNTGPLDSYVDAIPSGMNQQGRRWRKQSKTHSPTLLNRSKYSTAGSFGQTTATLPTEPTNTPNSNPYGAY
jgi:hypothetical protein